MITRVLLAGAFFVVRHLPGSLWVALIRALAFVASWLPSKEQNKIIANFNRVQPSSADIDFGTTSPRVFARRVFAHQALMAVETLRYSFNPATVTIDGLADYAKELKGRAPQGEGDSQPGVIIATGHIGSWELVGAATALAQDKTFTALAKAPENPDLLAALGSFRERLNIASLWNRDTALLKKMLATLRAGDALGMVIDQKPKSRKGYPVEFLGEPTAMVSGPIKMARKTGATIYGVYALRVAPFHYQLCWQRLADASSLAEQSDEQLAQLLADSMATAIAKAPSQWAWNYKRWSASSPSAPDRPAATPA